MAREISAGGVVLRKRDGEWWVAAIEPQDHDVDGEAAAGRTKKLKPTVALPKGLVDAGEKPLETALREVHEETGVRAQPITKLGDIKYIYTRTWGDGGRVFKIVSFYLMRYSSGRIDEITPEMRTEVARALWIRLDDAVKLLAYKGERQMTQRAQEFLQAHPELQE